MEAYHGSSYWGEIKKFKKSKSGALGSGLVYFSSKVETARYYAEKETGEGFVYTVELDIKNPLVIPPEMDPEEYILSPAVLSRRKASNCNYCYWLKASDYQKYRKQGYDAVIYRDEIAVFDPAVVKVKDRTPVKM